MSNIYKDFNNDQVVYVSTVCYKYKQYLHLAEKPRVFTDEAQCKVDFKKWYTQIQKGLNGNKIFSINITEKKISLRDGYFIIAGTIYEGGDETNYFEYKGEFNEVTVKEAE